MRILVKIGGAQLEQSAPRRELCVAISAARAAGHEIIVVHGGGNQIRTTCKALGIEDRYHQGLRITDRATAEVVLMVLGGLVNRTLVQSLATAGVPATGLTGADGGTFTAKRLVREGADLGFVGEVDRVDRGLIDTLIGNGITPVLATVAPGSDSDDANGDAPFYNVNADHAAGPLCRALDCDALLFLTDVPGVLDQHQKLLPLLTDADCRRLVETGIATGGMQPKLEAALLGARENPHAIVKIAAAAAEDCVLAALRDGAGSRFFANGARKGPAPQEVADG